jgi:hypothetical protein
MVERRILVEVAPASTLRLAHDALDAAWPQLARWLAETQSERAALAELEEAALTWERRGRHDRDTWSGAALAELARKIENWQLTVPTAARAFLDASLRNERDSRRRWRWLVAAMSLVMIALSILSLTFTRSEPDPSSGLDPLKAGREAEARANRTSLR